MKLITKLLLATMWGFICATIYLMNVGWSIWVVVIASWLGGFAIYTIEGD